MRNRRGMTSQASGTLTGAAKRMNCQRHATDSCILDITYPVLTPGGLLCPAPYGKLPRCNFIAYRKY
jgi:hypothetical protein